jgi:hypothetical protein
MLFPLGVQFYVRTSILKAHGIVEIVSYHRHASRLHAGIVAGPSREKRQLVVDISWWCDLTD